MKFTISLGLIIILNLIGINVLSQPKAILINHNSLVKFNSLPDSTIAKAMQLRFMFRHASIGFAISDGLDCLQGTKPQIECKIYPQNKYNRSNWSFQGRGNSGWYGKVDDFVLEVEKQINDFDIFAFKYCYLDGLDELAEPCGKPLSGEKINKAFVYLRDNMEMLQTKYKNKIFIWWTIPLTQIGQYCTDTLNSLIREYCKSNNKILFDIADIECYDTLGVKVTNEFGLEKAFKPYCGEQKPDAQACHPGRLGGLIIAKSLWVMIAEILEWEYPSNVDDNNDFFNFTISPNPANNFINISFPKELSYSHKQKSISLYNAFGMEIKKYKILETDFDISISTEDLLNGVYYCLYDDDNKRLAKAFIIIK